MVVYYYTPFQLVRLRDSVIESQWDTKIYGAHVFAVWKNYILLNGGYDDRDRFILLEWRDKNYIKPLFAVQFQDDTGQVLPSRAVITRGESLFFIKDNRCYRTTMEELMAAITV